MLKIMDFISNAANSFKDWIIDNSSNPLLWFGVLAFFLVFFGIAFKGLKQK